MVTSYCNTSREVSHLQYADQPQWPCEVMQLWGILFWLHGLAWNTATWLGQPVCVRNVSHIICLHRPWVLCGFFPQAHGQFIQDHSPWLEGDLSMGLITVAWETFHSWQCHSFIHQQKKAYDRHLRVELRKHMLPFSTQEKKHEKWCVTYISLLMFFTNCYLLIKL